ncbi:tol-pal system protein YbgF [Halodesulfovibrio marinisediminis]|uniref:Tol-pal system protein YbgF n=1 Tax=Halodesulfovibrio marinisediminis DSM 17456 TaxID=1121457 RepID=A0A1N6E0V6_9BACT|nr:tol-pal system protein YbgF [Halodesulfovibrio marinisediminis]SIN76622.1 tol-pal system protein YbgF [Halodesulfovibrio marinisediminis DSM 17456]
MRIAIRVTLLCLSALSLLACVKQEQVNLLERKLSQQEQQILALNNTLGSTSQALDSVRPEQADIWSELKGMKVSLATIEGQIEDVQAESGTVASLEADVANIKQRITQIEGAIRMMSSQLGIENYLPAPAPKTTTSRLPATSVQLPANGEMLPTQNGQVVQGAQPVEPAPVVPATPPQKVAPEDLAEALYKSALQAFNERRYEDAQRMWSEYEKTYPKSKLAANAKFWQGEAYFQMKNYARATLAYEDVIKKYPKSNKFPQALLKQGLSFIKQGKKNAGKFRLNQLIEKFPKSVEAKRAKQELAKL